MVTAPAQGVFLHKQNSAKRVRFGENVAVCMTIIHSNKPQDFRLIVPKRRVEVIHTSISR